MNKFEEAYLKIIKESEGDSTESAESAESAESTASTASTAANANTIYVSIDGSDFGLANKIKQECKRYGITFEQHENSCTLEGPIESKKAIKRILLKYWTYADGLDGALGGVESSYPEFYINDEKISFKDFFAEEIAKCGYKCQFYPNVEE